MLAEARHQQIKFGRLWPRLSICACAVSDYRQLEDLGLWILVQHAFARLLLRRARVITGSRYVSALYRLA